MSGKAQAKNEVEAKAGTELAVVDFGDDAGKGMENVGHEEFRVPFLRVLQSNSPQCKPPTAGGLAGAKAGMIINLATNDLYDGEAGLIFVPTSRAHNFVEYVPRDSGGGFVGIHEANEPLILELRAKHGKFGKLITNDGNEIVETFYLYGIAIAPDSTIFRCLVAFASTQIKKYQNFITRYMNIKYPMADGQMVLPPLWAHRWNLGTAYEKNKKGEFFGWRLRMAELNPDGTEAPARKSLMNKNGALYVAGREFYQMIETGTAKADFQQNAAVREPGDDTDEVPM